MTIEKLEKRFKEPRYFRNTAKKDSDCVFRTKKNKRNNDRSLLRSIFEIQNR